MLPNPSKCHIRPKIKKSHIFIIKLKSLRAPPSWWADRSHTPWMYFLSHPESSKCHRVPKYIALSCSILTEDSLQAGPSNGQPIKQAPDGQDSMSRQRAAVRWQLMKTVVLIWILSLSKISVDVYALVQRTRRHVFMLGPNPNIRKNCLQFSILNNF